MKTPSRFVRILSRVCRTIACAMLLIQVGQAALPYSDGDILLGFRATGGEGATTDYLINIGSITQFTSTSGQLSVNVGNIATDLSNTFGADWKTRSDVLWSVSGVQKVAGNGFPSNNTMFVSRAELTPGTQSVPWTRASAFGAGTPAGKILSMSGSAGYAAGATADQTISPNNPKALLQSTNAVNSYASFQPGGSNTVGTSAFAFFNAAGGIEGNFANGTSGSVLDFYKLEPGSGNAVLVGGFKLDNNGNLTLVTDISVFAPPATVGLELTSYQVNEDVVGGQLAIKLVRTGNAGTAFTVNFSTTDGTAVAGADFTGQTNVPVSFAANDTNKAVNVTIARRTGFQGGRQFSVALSSPTGNVSLSTASTATVGIIEVDPAPPSVALSATSFPVNEDAGSLAVTLTRTGDATSAFTVNFSTTDGTALAGTDFTGQTNTAVSFAANETSKMVNVAVAHRTGFQGNRSFNVALSSPSGATLGAPNTATVAILEVDPQPSTLVFGAATTSVVENVAGGTVALTITRSGVTTGAGSVAFSTADGTALAGTDYTAQTNVPVDFAANETTKTVNVAVLDRAGFQQSRRFTAVLSNSTNGGVLGATATVTVTITDKDTQTTSIIAGNYRGLIASAGTPSHMTTGYIALTVATGGAFTGALRLDDGTLSFKGKFDTAGAATFSPGATTSLKLKLNCLTPMDLGTMTLNIVGDVISGETKNPGVTGTVHAERDAFDGTTAQTSVDPAFLANRGTYTAVLPSKDQTGLAATAFPPGDGIGFAKVAKTGTVRISGFLADGSPFACSTALTKDYTCPLFASLYNAGGSLSGTLAFKVQAGSDFTGTNLLWLRPLKTRATYYPAGWPAGIRLDLLGASYAIPPARPAASVFPGLGEVDRVNGNAKIEFSDGKLSALLSKNLNISTANIVYGVPATNRSATVAITRATGLVAGRFVHSDRTATPFRAVIVQKGATSGAFGYFLSTVPRGGATGESGGVSITAK